MSCLVVTLAVDRATLGKALLHVEAVGKMERRYHHE